VTAGFAIVNNTEIKFPQALHILPASLFNHCRMGMTGMNLAEQDENQRENLLTARAKISVQRIYNTFTNKQRGRIISV
jgi:hypothetical protein